MKSKAKPSHYWVDPVFSYTSFSPVDSSIESKFSVSPTFLTSFFQKTKTLKDSVLYGYPFSITSKTNCCALLHILPHDITRVIKQKLIGIYFYRNLSVDGHLHSVYTGKKRYYVIACDQRILNKNISEYLSEKENSRFIPSKNQIAIKTDTTLNALFYVLLHEIFHIVDYENKISISTDELGYYSGIKTPFVTKFWRFPNVPQDSTFNNRYLIGDLYNKENNRLIDSCLVIPIYTELSKGNFASYYSTANFQEDIAEFLTLYYLTQHLNSIYEIEICKNDKLLLSFRPFENRQLLERLNELPQNIQLLLKK